MFNSISVSTYSAGRVVQIARFRCRYLLQRKNLRKNLLRFVALNLSRNKPQVCEEIRLYAHSSRTVFNSKYWKKTLYQLEVSDDLRAEINCLSAANCSAASRWQQNSFNSLTVRRGRGRSAGKGGGESIALSVNKAVSDWVVLPAGHPCRPIFYTYLFYINCSILSFYTKPVYKIFTYFITMWTVNSYFLTALT